jgi:hypothetical protein
MRPPGSTSLLCRFSIVALSLLCSTVGQGVGQVGSLVCPARVACCYSVVSAAGHLDYFIKPQAAETNSVGRASLRDGSPAGLPASLGGLAPWLGRLDLPLPASTTPSTWCCLQRTGNVNGSGETEPGSAEEQPGKG